MLIKSSGGYTVPLIKVWNSPEDVCLEDIPARCVIKSNCSCCSENIIIVDENHPIKQEQLDEIKNIWFDKMRMPTNSFSNVYHAIKPRVLIEENIGEIIEYKLFCFHGQPEFLYVKSDQFVNNEKNDEFPLSFYDVNWKYMNVSFGNYVSKSELEKPERFDEMVGIAKCLSAAFTFVRVDFFYTHNGLYIAELTFDPSGGLIRYPESFDQYMMRLIKGN